MTSKDNGRSMGYRVFSVVVLLILALLFLFPLYWIITGALKTPAAINSVKPQWWPSEFTLRNFQVLFSKRSAPLFQFGSVVGPTVPAAGSTISSSRTARSRSASSRPTAWRSSRRWRW